MTTRGNPRTSNALTPCLPSTLEAIQPMWRKNLGIEVRLLQREFKVKEEDVQQKHYQISLGSWRGDYLDPTALLDVLHSTNGNNHTGWASPAHDRLLHEAAQVLESARRLEVLRRAESLLLDELPVIPLYY